MKEKQLICIACPVGCALTVRFAQDGTIQEITGNSCKRGIPYAEAEVTNPTRSLTTTMRVRGGTTPLVAVKSEQPIPKRLQKSCVEVISAKSVKAPVAIGDTLLEDILSTGISIVATSHCAAR